MNLKEVKDDPASFYPRVGGRHALTTAVSVAVCVAPSCAARNNSKSKTDGVVGGIVARGGELGPRFLTKTRSVLAMDIKRSAHDPITPVAGA